MTGLVSKVNLSGMTAFGAKRTFVVLLQSIGGTIPMLSAAGPVQPSDCLRSTSAHSFVARRAASRQQRYRNFIVAARCSISYGGQFGMERGSLPIQQLASPPE